MEAIYICVYQKLVHSTLKYAYLLTIVNLTQVMDTSLSDPLWKTGSMHLLKLHY